MCYVNKPLRPGGTGKGLTGGSAATERRKTGESRETKEEEYWDRSSLLPSEHGVTYKVT